MRIGTSITPSLLAFASTSTALYLGALHPAPYDLSSEQSLVAAAWKNITSQLDAIADGTTELPLISEILSGATWSLNAYSVNDPAASELLQYHHTGPLTSNAETGTREVDSNSIYPVASVTKLLSVYVAKQALTDEMWQKPLSQIWPELSTSDTNERSANVNSTLWDEITAFHLASQISGLPQWGPTPYSNELAEKVASVDEALQAGIPPSALDAAAADYANASTLCTTLDAPCEDYWVSAHSWRDPIRKTFTEPGYSNNGYILFGLTLTRLTGKSLAQLYAEYLSEPLGLQATNVVYPGGELENRTVILNATTFAVYSMSGNFSGSGGVTTSLNEMATIGISILNSTLLSPVQTREWMKPVSFTENFEYSVGAPWEISRVVSKTSGKIIDIYPKSGDSGPASAYLVTIPDFQAGFNIALAYSSANETLLANKIMAASAVADLLVELLIPALEAQAEQEAAAKFSGTYSSSAINSSLTVSGGEVGHGIYITEWISNGTDLCSAPLAAQLACPIQLQPTDDRRDPSSGAGQVLFHNPLVTPEVIQEAEGMGPFSRQWLVGEWVSVPGYMQLGGINIDTFVFTTGPEGEAQSVIPSGLRITLDKQATS